MRHLIVMTVAFVHRELIGRMTKEYNERAIKVSICSF